MKHDWENFGDVSPDYGQNWISGDSRDDWATVIDIVSGSDIGLADNQYRIERGSVYLGGDWNGPMSCCGYDKIGPPEFLEIASMVCMYQGFDSDIYGFDIVQIGKTVDDWTASGTTCEDPTILHGNTSIENYIQREWLQ